MKIVIYGILFSLSILIIWISPQTNTIFLINTTQIVISSLFILILFILKERFFNNLYFTIVTYLIIVLLVFLVHYYYGFLTLIAFDMMDKRQYYFGIPFAFLSIYVIIEEHSYLFLYFLVLSSMLGYIVNLNHIQQKHFLSSLDNERRLRYELETMKTKLMHHSHEIERLTEIKERNRIAHEIHDHIGHDLAGILIQLQATEKVFKKDAEKSFSIISLCVSKLSYTLEVIRNTVYNIKPNKEINESIFRAIIEQFIFAKINFSCEGDLTSIKPELLEVMVTNLKESLTNASKYSGATEIHIKIEANTNYIRFYYKDNGIGCKTLKEGLGIKGMKERIKHYNGMMNIDGNDGFSILCVIPNKKTNIFQVSGDE